MPLKIHARRKTLALLRPAELAIRVQQRLRVEPVTHVLRRLPAAHAIHVIHVQRKLPVEPAIPVIRAPRKRHVALATRATPVPRLRAARVIPAILVRQAQA